MRSTTLIEDIMTRKPSTVTPLDNLDTVRKIFEKHGFHHVPVVEDGKLIGIVSYTDYLRIISELFSGITTRSNSQTGLNNMLVKDLMTEQVVCLSPTNTVEDALSIFNSHQFHAMPVVEGNRRLVGILSTYDLMKVLEKIMGSEIDYAG